MRPDRSEGCPFLIQVKSVGSGKAGGSCRRSTGTLTSAFSWSLTTKLSRKLGGPVVLNSSYRYSGYCHEESRITIKCPGDPMFLCSLYTIP